MWGLGTAQFERDFHRIDRWYWQTGACHGGSAVMEWGCVLLVVAGVPPPSLGSAPVAKLLGVVAQRAACAIARHVPSPARSQ